MPCPLAWAWNLSLTLTLVLYIYISNTYSNISVRRRSGAHLRSWKLSSFPVNAYDVHYSSCSCDNFTRSQFTLTWQIVPAHTSLASSNMIQPSSASPWLDAAWVGEWAWRICELANNNHAMKNEEELLRPDSVMKVSNIDFSPNGDVAEN